MTGFSEEITGLNATTYTFTQNGTFTFTFQDIYGNQGTAIAQVDWIDKIAPTATVSYSTTDLTNQDVIASLTNVSDDVITIPAPITFELNGTNEFVITDNAGNSTTIPASVTWIDKVAPTADVAYAPSTLTNTDVVASLTNVSTDVASIPTPMTFAGNGTGEFMITDNAGNTSMIPTSVTWIDKELPVITLNDSSSITLEFGATYTDAGASALDNVDGDISANIVA